jgi:hypothetical protein
VGVGAGSGAGVGSAFGVGEGAGLGCVGRRSVSSPLIGPMHVDPAYGIRSVLLSTMWAVPVIENGQDGKPGTVALPLTV